MRTFSGTTYGRGEVGLGEAQAHDRRLRDREGDQHAEAVEAGEEPRLVRPTEAETITSVIETAAAPRIAAGGSVLRRPNVPNACGSI